MVELDRRSKQKGPTSTNTMKTRVEGQPSKSKPPLNCPSWAMSREWKEGMHM